MPVGERPGLHVLSTTAQHTCKRVLRQVADVTLLHLYSPNPRTWQSRHLHHTCKPYHAFRSTIALGECGVRQQPLPLAPHKLHAGCGMRQLPPPPKLAQNLFLHNQGVGCGVPPFPHVPVVLLRAMWQALVWQGQPSDNLQRANQLPTTLHAFACVHLWRSCAQGGVHADAPARWRADRHAIACFAGGGGSQQHTCCGREDVHVLGRIDSLRGGL